MKTMNSSQSCRKSERFFFSNVHCAGMHYPDKNAMADTKTKDEKKEIFKEIINAYMIVAEVIIETDTMKEEDEFYEDEEEEFETEDQGYEFELYKGDFKDVFMFSTNTRSVTIKIPTIHADAWIDVLEENIGITSEKSSSANGIQFKTADGVSVTLSRKKMTKAHFLLMERRSI